MRKIMIMAASSFAISAMFLGTSALPVFPAASAAAQESETVLHSGEWSKVSFKASGTWRIVQKDAKRFIELSSDFKTRNAPDLKIFLSSAPADTLTGRNATDSSVLVSELNSNRGAQRYELPEDLDLADFSSIMIHCERYTKLWSVSDL